MVKISIITNHIGQEGQFSNPHSTISRSVSLGHITANFNCDLDLEIFRRQTCRRVFEGMPEKLNSGRKSTLNMIATVPELQS